MRPTPAAEDHGQGRRGLVQKRGLQGLREAVLPVHSSRTQDHARGRRGRVTAVAPVSGSGSFHPRCKQDMASTLTTSGRC